MRTLLIIILLGMLVAAGYFAYSAMAIEGEPIPTEGYVALALGAGFAIVVGIGLMMLLFSFSSRRGYDEPPHFR
ncbi:Zn-dependent protease with chaperone function [Bradyrhizobium japonicum]